MLSRATICNRSNGIWPNPQKAVFGNRQRESLILEESFPLSEPRNSESEKGSGFETK
jgi:hypothetical protein